MHAQLTGTAAAAFLAAAAQAQVLHYQATYNVDNPTGSLIADGAENWTATADYFLDLDAVTDPGPTDQFDPITFNEIFSGTLSFFDNNGSFISSYTFENEGITIEDADPNNPFAGAFDYDGGSTNIDAFTTTLGNINFSVFGHAFELPDDTFDTPAVSEAAFDTMFLSGAQTRLFAIEPDGDFADLTTTSVTKVPSPGSLVVLGVAGAAAASRRRRDVSTQPKNTLEIS